ncbi:hypothetical protein BwSH20_75890 [Bradyrhizobium ottawaense]|nr:hypothetical protein BwSH20_75890 [Bradyrhizobium ottawaense]GMO52241.1 hypothetical protein BwSF21_75590 [Bradyrhizobium ottawaense]GMO53564.1 hypothetical protein BwSH14_77000 [Bradyrhizobium ottawaense]GMO53673.1 hypothetical protein BwSF12_65570 [Bradyrhizobium ottawaense]GMO86124.1 hypothetical protein BwSG20_73300 [Bradyrhizobium ottawaense]
MVVHGLCRQARQPIADGLEPLEAGRKCLGQAVELIVIHIQAAHLGQNGRRQGGKGPRRQI